MFFPSGFSNAIDLLNEPDEEKSSKKDFILACVLVSEYLFEKKERPTFHSRKRIEWEKHIEEMAVEGPEGFQKNYRIEYITFMKLCDIIRSKIMVDDEMAR